MTTEERAEVLSSRIIDECELSDGDAAFVRGWVLSDLRYAVAAERERCARHADDAAANARQFGSGATSVICEAIASRIREGQP